MSRWIRPQLALILAAALAVAPLTVLAAPEEAERSLSGRVFASDLQTPLAGVSVQVTPKNEERLVAETVTDEAGRFVLEGLAEEVYTLVLLDDGTEPLAAAHVDAATQNQIALAVPPTRPGEAATAPAASAGGSGGVAAWLSTPLGATVALVAGATIVAVSADSLTDDDPEREDLPPASKSQP